MFSKNFGDKKPNDILIYRIKHYAGSVTYSSTGFLSKNSDALTRDLSCVLYSSNHPLLRTLFPEGKFSFKVQIQDIKMQRTEFGKLFQIFSFDLFCGVKKSFYLLTRHFRKKIETVFLVKNGA